MPKQDVSQFGFELCQCGLGESVCFTIRDSVLNCDMVLGVGELVDGVDALVCGLRLATLRSGDDLWDQVSPTGRIFSWRALPRFGGLCVRRSLEGAPGHGKARERHQPGTMPNLDASRFGF